MSSGPRGVTGLIKRAPRGSQAPLNLFVGVKGGALNLNNRIDGRKLLCHVRNANCDNSHKHIYGHDWKEEGITCLGFPASDYNHPGKFLSSTLPFSEIGGKSHRTGHLYPSHVRISRLLSIAALLVFCQSCSLVKTVGESEMQIISFKSFAYCYSYRRTNSAIRLQCIYYISPSVTRTK
jgi:hypothetical protein